MKKRILLSIFGVLALLSSISFSLTTASERRAESKWMPIIGFKSKAGQVFYNVNSITKIEKDGSIYVSGEVLIISNQEREVMGPDNTKLKAKSMVTDMLVECGSGLSAATVDFFFKEEKPKRSDRPLTARKHSSLKDTARILDKSDPIYNTFCPTYI